jgi:hypothetical protein
MFDRLPLAWKRLDLTYGPDGRPVPGFLERFLAVLDSGFDRSHDKAEELLTSRSVDNIPDRYLALLTAFVGQRWRSGKPHDWHRRKTASAIPRWSYLGSDVCLADLIREYGGTQWDVVDMASRVIVLDKQSKLDVHRFECADYYHQGAYVLTVDDGIDIEGFKQDFEDIKPAGTRWFIYLNTAIATAFETIGCFQTPTEVFMANVLDYTIDSGILDENMWLDGVSPFGAFRVSTPNFMQLLGIFDAQVDLTDTLVLLSDTDIYLNQGSPENPLPDATAGRRAVFEIT